MPAANVVSSDPHLSDAEESRPEMDFLAHVRTFNAVVGMMKWFVAHLALILVALYFFAIAGDTMTGTFFLLCTVALFIFGVLRRTAIRRDVADAMATGPGETFDRLERTS